jgi:hypothetical protein
MEYRPDRWVVLNIKTDEGIIQKVLAGWSGGYLDCDSWKLNSGIERVEETDTHYTFHGYSGSSYVCSKTSYGFTSLMWSIFDQIKHVADIDETYKEKCLG